MSISSLVYETKRRFVKQLQKPANVATCVGTLSETLVDANEGKMTGLWFAHSYTGMSRLDLDDEGRNLFQKGASAFVPFCVRQRIHCRETKNEFFFVLL